MLNSGLEFGSLAREFGVQLRHEGLRFVQRTSRGLDHGLRLRREQPTEVWSERHHDGFVLLGDEGLHGVTITSFQVFRFRVKPRVVFIGLGFNGRQLSSSHGHRGRNVGLRQPFLFRKGPQSLERIVLSCGGHGDEMCCFHGPFDRHDGEAKVQRYVSESTQNGVGMNAVLRLSTGLDEQQRSPCAGFQAATLVQQSTRFDGFKQVSGGFPFDQYPLRETQVSAWKLGEHGFKSEALQVSRQRRASFTMVDVNNRSIAFDFVEVVDLQDRLR